MKPVLNALIAIAVFTGPLSLAQEAERKIYRTTDEYGNPVFSDQGSPDAEEVEVRESITLPSEALNDEYEAVFGGREQKKTPESASFKYNALRIVSPPDNEAIRANNGDIQLSVEVDPGPMADHKVELMMDGVAIRELTGSSLMLQNVDRGTHQARLRVTDRKSGKVLQQGPITTFTVLRHSVRN